MSSLFNFGTTSQRIREQINMLEVGCSKVVDPYGMDSFSLSPVVQSVGRSLQRKYSLKTDKQTGKITVTRISLVSPPINYTQFLQGQIKNMGVGVSKVLRTKGRDTFSCSPFVASIGKKLDKKFKLKTDKATGKIWVGRVS